MSAIVEGRVLIKSLYQAVVCSCLLALTCVYSEFSLAAGNIESALAVGKHSTIIRAEYLEDVSNELSINQVRGSDSKLGWKVVLEDVANFGYQKHPFWYRFDIANPRNESISQIVELAYPLLDSLDYYRFDGESELVQFLHTGDKAPYNSRLIDHPNFLFPLNLGPHETVSIYLKVVTAGSQLVPLVLWNDIELFSTLSREAEVHAAYFGIVLVIVFLNLMIFFGLREKVFLYYAVNTFLFMLFFAVMRGKLYPFIMSESPAFHHLLLLLLPPLCLLSSALFTREFLSVRDYGKPLNILIALIIFVAWACIAGVFVLDSQESLQLSVLCAIPGSFLLLLFGPILTLKGNKIAWVYTLAWGALMLGAALAALSKQGVIPLNFLTQYGMQIGSALEIFILNMALAYRIYRETKDRISAQEISLLESVDRHEAEKKLLDASMSHPVTMMPNRICFEQQINQSIKGPMRSLAVCTVDNKRYADICKTLGQQNADLMLCELAKRYNRYLSDIPGIIQIQGASFQANLCSLDSGTFGFILDTDVARNNRVKMREVIAKLTKPIEFKEMRLELQPSIGAAFSPEHGLNASTLLRHSQVAADTKEKKEGAVSYYRPEQDHYNARRLMMISELKEAIRCEQLVLYFQPKYNHAKGKVVGVEALVRWNHKRYGLVRPDEFIPIAEQTGVIKMLTRWVFKNALENYVALRKANYALSMSINISAVNLKEPDLIGFFKQCIEDYQVDPKAIYLELTETSMMEHPERAIETLEKISELGFRISIDDFGSGYSSLAYLNTLPATEIKIDRSLVLSLTDNERSESVLKATIEMCHGLGFEVIAEGVETQEVMDELTALSCDLIQGYLLTPPLPLNRLIEWLENHEATQRFAS